MSDYLITLKLYTGNSNPLFLRPKELRSLSVLRMNDYLTPSCLALVSYTRIDIDNNLSQILDSKTYLYLI